MTNPVVEIDLELLSYKVDHSLREAVIKIFGRVVDSIVVASASRFEFACSYYNVKHGATVVTSPLATPDTAHFFCQGEMVAKWNYRGAFKGKEITQ